MDSQMVLIVAPLVVLQLGLLIWALYDLTRADRKVRWDSKILWALIIIFISIVGPVLYFLFGREEA